MGLFSFVFIIKKGDRMDDISIYTNKDGRTRVYIKKERRVISYPRFLMEREIGRSLEANEQIHHMDGNPLNNDVSNLEIRLSGEHQREHSTKYFDKMATCDWCGCEFLWTAKQQRIHYSNLSRKTEKRGARVFCSKSCCGQCGRASQLI